MKKAMGVVDDNDDSEVEEIVELLEPVSVTARACLFFFSFLFIGGNPSTFWSPCPSLHVRTQFFSFCFSLSPFTTVTEVEEVFQFYKINAEKQIASGARVRRRTSMPVFPFPPAPPPFLKKI